MNVLILRLVLLLLLALANWIIIKTPPIIRGMFFTTTIIASIMIANIYGHASEKLLCLGNYIMSFERYSTVLSDLAREKRYDELAQDVIFFDQKWKLDSQSPSNLDRLVTELERKNNQETSQGQEPK